MSLDHGCVQHSTAQSRMVGATLLWLLHCFGLAFAHCGRRDCEGPCFCQDGRNRIEAMGETRLANQTTVEDEEMHGDENKQQITELPMRNHGPVDLTMARPGKAELVDMVSHGGSHGLCYVCGMVWVWSWSWPCMYVHGQSCMSIHLLQAHQIRSPVRSLARRQKGEMRKKKKCSAVQHLRVESIYESCCCSSPSPTPSPPHSHSCPDLYILYIHPS